MESFIVQIVCGVISAIIWDGLKSTVHMHR